MKPRWVFAMTALAAVVAGCSGEPIRTESSSVLVREATPAESLRFGLVVALALAFLALMLWLMLRKRGR